MARYHRYAVQHADNATFWLVEFRDNKTNNMALVESSIGFTVEKSKAIFCGKSVFERVSGEVYPWVPRSYNVPQGELDRVQEQCNKYPDRFGGKYNLKTSMSEDCKSF